MTLVVFHLQNRYTLLDIVEGNDSSGESNSSSQVSGTKPGSEVQQGRVMSSSAISGRRLVS